MIFCCEKQVLIGIVCAFTSLRHTAVMIYWNTWPWASVQRCTGCVASNQSEFAWGGVVANMYMYKTSTLETMRRRGENICNAKPRPQPVVLFYNCFKYFIWVKKREMITGDNDLFLDFFSAKKNGKKEDLNRYTSWVEIAFLRLFTFIFMHFHDVEST